MKRIIIILSVFLFGATACSQYTCPTYADAEVETTETEKVVEGEQSI